MLPIKESELATFAPIAPVGEPPRAKYERLIMTAKKVPPATTVVVHPCEETSLRGAVDAAEAGGGDFEGVATRRRAGADLARALRGHRRYPWPRRRAAPCVSAQTLAGASLRTR